MFSGPVISAKRERIKSDCAPLMRSHSRYERARSSLCQGSSHGTPNQSFVRVGVIQRERREMNALLSFLGFVSGRKEEEG